MMMKKHVLSFFVIFLLMVPTLHALRAWDDMASLNKGLYIASAALTAFGISAIVTTKGFDWPQHWACSKGSMALCKQNITQAPNVSHINYECSDDLIGGRFYCHDVQNMVLANERDPNWVDRLFIASVASLCGGGSWFLSYTLLFAVEALEEKCHTQKAARHTSAPI